MRFWLFLILTCFAATLRAQQVDSLLQVKLRTDTLLAPKQAKLDSLQRSFYEDSDRLKASGKARLASLDSSQARVEHKIDSLQSLQLPVEKYTRKLDSLRQQREKTAVAINKKMEDLKAKTTGRINDLELPSELQEKAASITKNINDFQLPAKDLNIGSLSLPDNPLKNLDGLNTSVQSPVGEIGNVPSLDGLPKDLGRDLSDITGEVAGYQDGLQEITGGIKDVQQLPAAAEGKVASLAGVGDLPKETDILDPMLKGAQSPEALKEQAQQQVQQVAVNHFAGKEQVLQEAMEKMSKLKQKYSSLNSLSEIPKRRPNEMRGKPLVERILPGIAIQIQKKNDNLLVDFNPYAGYRFTGRLTAGLGWNHRIAYNTDDYYFANRHAIYGPRMYGEFKIGKGFSPRAEIETMNTLVPPLTRTAPSDLGSREWVWGAFAGMKKEYRFLKNVKGTALIMVRLMNPQHKSPYADVINMRIGFEFPMKKKVKQRKEAEAEGEKK
jgi:hypothetical protein